MANINSKLLKRNIKLLGVGKGNEILKIENSPHLKAVRKTSPRFPAAARAARAHFNDSQRERGKLLYFLHAWAAAHNVHRCLVLGHTSNPQFSHSTDVERRFHAGSCLQTFVSGKSVRLRVLMPCLSGWLVRPLACIPYHATCKEVFWWIPWVLILG